MPDYIMWIFGTLLILVLSIRYEKLDLRKNDNKVVYSLLVDIIMLLLWCGFFYVIP